MFCSLKAVFQCIGADDSVRALQLCGVLWDVLYIEFLMVFETLSVSIYSENDSFLFVELSVEKKKWILLQRHILQRVISFHTRVLFNGNQMTFSNRKRTVSLFPLVLTCSYNNGLFDDQSCCRPILQLINTRPLTRKKGRQQIQDHTAHNYLLFPLIYPLPISLHRYGFHLRTSAAFRFEITRRATWNWKGLLWSTFNSNGRIGVEVHPAGPRCHFKVYSASVHRRFIETTWKQLWFFQCVLSGTRVLTLNGNERRRICV
jgi:hypothetical protein